MKKVFGIFTAIVLAVFFVSCTLGKPVVEKVRTITVDGTGSVEVVPNVAEITFTVVTGGWSARQIVADNDTITNRFVDAVIALGVPKDSITRSECSVSNPGNSYESRRTVKVSVINMALIPAVIDCKTTSVRLNGVSFEYTDSASEVRRARTAAIKNAQDAASLLAGASGCKTADVVAIANEKITQTKTDDGKITITSTLTVTYDLQ